jgi:hypothetical protein
MNSYGTLCDDFGINMHLVSKVELPTNRETVLHYFESLRKLYPKMTDFEKRDSNEYVLEEERDSGSYRWAAIDSRRLSSGFVNPPTLEDADSQNEKILEMAPFHVGVHTLDTEALEVVYYFDLAYSGNHDEVVGEALGENGPFESMMKLSGARLLNYQPNLTVALDESCHLQARFSVETRTTPYHVRTGNFPEIPITVYCTVRQFWTKQPFKTFAESYHNQRRLLDELATEHVLPKIIQPLQRVIGAKS